MEDLDRTYALGERALTLIKKNQSPATPQNYELWYTFSTGHDSELNQAVKGILSARANISEIEGNRLYERFVSPDRVTEKVDEVGKQISDEVGQIVNMIETTLASAGSYNEKLGGISEKIKTAHNTNDLKEVVSSLVAATKTMENESLDLEKKLLDSKQQVADLRSNLETVRAESMTDQLTGIANRKKFDSTMVSAMEEARQTGESFCLVMADIDHFKKFNDTFGHQTGDQVLRLVAHTLKSNLKGRDLAARYGGEEFSLILPMTPLLAASKVADIIRKAVMAKELVKKTTGESLGSVTMSFGVASLRPNESGESLIHRADACLYAAKRGGRNMVKNETDTDIDLNINAA